ncbi:MAG TPA: ATP synthase F1 subunit delta [Vicinamibacterales bacterium]|nr:ATP synthase F1 subunit delta [Vicinamibacterales bacterium]
MTSATAAGRYARALFDVILQEAPGSIETVQGDLQQFADLVSGNEALASVVGNPAIPASKKIALAKALLDRAGNVSAPLAKLIVMLAERDRLTLLPDVARVYRSRVMDHLKIVRGEVTTAIALAPEKLRALEQGLERATGRKVLLEMKVDPSIIGGVVTRLGSTVYDGSVTTQLQKMKQSLIEAGQ